ncbi:hypothetical protein [Algoriphagus namhaensis]
MKEWDDYGFLPKNIEPIPSGMGFFCVDFYYSVPDRYAASPEAAFEMVPIVQLQEKQDNDESEIKVQLLEKQDNIRNLDKLT